MEFRRLRYFVATAEELNLHTAAERLGISQPAVSQQLNLLESELGLALFVREKQRVVALTTAGAAYLTHARRTLFSLDNAMRSTREIAQGKLGVLRVGVCEEIATPRGLAVIIKAREAMPTIAFEFVELPPLDLPKAVRSSQIDVAFVLLPCSAPGVAVHVLWRDSWVVVMPREHPLSSRAWLTCEDLADQDLILGHAQTGAGGHDLIRAAFSDAGLTPKVAVQALRRSAMLTLVAAGMGLTFMPEFLRTVDLPELAMVPLAREQMTLAIAYAEAPSEPVRLLVEQACSLSFQPAS